MKRTEIEEDTLERSQRFGHAHAACRARVVSINPLSVETRWSPGRVSGHRGLGLRREYFSVGDEMRSLRSYTVANDSMPVNQMNQDEGHTLSNILW